MKMELLITKGQNSGFRQAITAPQRILIGRDATCDLTITDPLLSRQHCLVEITQNAVKIIDLKSRNGTFVNGRRIVEMVLSAQDEVKVGRHTFLVRQQTGASSAPEGANPAGFCKGCGVPVTDQDLQNMRAIRYGVNVYCYQCIEKGIEPDQLPGSVGAERRRPAPGGGNFAETASEIRIPSIGAPQGGAIPSMPNPVTRRPGNQPSQANKQNALGLTKVGPYEILQILGEGGMGAVYKARHSFLETIAAIKVIKEELSSQPDIVKRFLQEAKLGVALDHTNILRIFDAGEHDGTYFFSMEFFAGKDVSQILKEQGTFPSDILLSLSIQMADALAYAHSKGVIHRDVKPSNILVDGSGMVKIADFGLAKAWQKAGAHQLTASGQMLGTIQYMSPEQLEDARTVSPATDIFSLGATLYFALAGFPPFGEEPLGKVIENILHNDPPALREVAEGVPPEFEEVIMKSLAKKASLRYPDMGSFKQDLMRVAENV